VYQKGGLVDPPFHYL